MLPAIKKQSERDPVPGPMIAEIVDLFQIERLDAPAGEYVTEANQPNDSPYGKLRFMMEETDVLLEISIPGAVRYLQVRKAGAQWKVVAEY
jgi:hypothetical protein